MGGFDDGLVLGLYTATVASTVLGAEIVRPGVFEEWVYERPYLIGFAAGGALAGQSLLDGESVAKAGFGLLVGVVMIGFGYGRAVERRRGAGGAGPRG